MLKKTFIFYFGHPAQYLFARETIKELKLNHNVILLLKTKDVLENLVKLDKLDYINILPEERGKSKLSIIKSLIKRIFLIIPIILKNKADVLISTDASIAIVGRLFKRHVITITEDDYNIIKALGDLTYPYTSSIFCPVPCDVGKWGYKKVGYYGYMKLSYLHPQVFKPDRRVVQGYSLSKKYALIRVAKLTAHHDFGVKGLDADLIWGLIRKFEVQNIQPLISSESPLTDDLLDYELKINPNDMHHVLYFATMLVCDSQSMCVEAAMLGVPSLRYSSFAGKISVLEELEHVYQLTFGIPVGNREELEVRLNELLELGNIDEIFSRRREAMLNEKINVSKFFTWFVENYPRSNEIIKKDSDYQFQFK
jgi:predicted glycosyltransferase